MTSRLERERRAYVRRRRITDLSLGGIGVCLALASLYFPWHVYFRGEPMSVPRLEFSRQGDLYGEPEDRLAIATSGYLPQIPGRLVDPLVTGGISSEESDLEDAAESQTYPGELSGYRVLYSANGRALVRDRDSIFIVGRNSRLPKGGRVREISRVDGNWQVLTSSGEIISGQ